MKKVILVAVAVMLSAVTFAQDKGIKFMEGTLTELRAESAKTGKPIFIDVYTTWCGPCKFLSSDIFPKEDVGKYMNAGFVNGKFDAEKGEGVEIAKTYNVKNYPTMLILDDKGKEIGRVVGASRTTEDFIKRIKENSVKK